jgi:hypothetical protein
MTVGTKQDNKLQQLISEAYKDISKYCTRKLYFNSEKVCGYTHEHPSHKHIPESP